MLLRSLALATLLVLSCAACSRGSTDQGAPLSSSSAPSTPAAPTSASISPGLAGYTAKQRAAYDDAVVAYAAFVKRNDHFYAVGKTTVGAKDFYQRYSIDWATAWGNLAQVANNGVTVSGDATVLWTKPVSISLGTSSGDAVTIKRCLDESERVVKQGGKVVEQPQLATPHVYTVQMEKRSSEGRWRSGEPDQGSTC
jgi:hypothetical protein